MPETTRVGPRGVDEGTSEVRPTGENVHWWVDREAFASLTNFYLLASFILNTTKVTSSPGGRWPAQVVTVSTKC